jgi:RHS repeat-associated protein
MGNSVTWAYDSKDNIISEIDVNGNTTVFAYNISGYLVSKSDAIGNTTSFTYDNNGNRLTKTDANGNTTTYAYDASSGRYTRKDIVLIDDVGNHQYVYASNNPVNLSDKYGLFFYSDVFSCILTGAWINPDGEKHLNRNMLNYCPKLEPHETGWFGKNEDCHGNKWNWDIGQYANGHCYCTSFGQYHTFRGTGIYRGSQCTYKSGKLVSDKCMGTYDYSPPSSPFDLWGHYCLDMLPGEINSNYKQPDLTHVYDG